VTIIAEDGKGYSSRPTFSGDAKVTENGRTIYSGGGGCDAGAGIATLALLPLAAAGRKRKATPK
jgi:Synergist-CTERM protein sorting domain-containing protein